MSGSTSQKVVLGVLVLALGWVLFGGPGGSGDGDGSLRARLTDQRRQATQGRVVTDVVALELERLEPSEAVFSIGRDPFRYGEDPKPPPPPPKPPPPKPPPPKVEPKPDPRPPEPQPPSTAHLTYLGSFGPQGRPIAVLVSGEEIFNVREGDRVEDAFVVETIGLESIDIGFVEFPEAPPDRLASGG